MYQIREGVFETNSSSTHSITFMSENEYDDWKNGDVYLNEVDSYDSTSEYVHKKFVTRDEATDILNCNEYYSDYFYDYIYDEAIPEPKELDDEGLARFHIYTFENYMNKDLDTDINSYTTNTGEKVYTVCSYGWD